MPRRTLKKYAYGVDVEEFARAAYQYLHEPKSLAAFDKQPKAMRRTYGSGKVTLCKRVADKANLPQYGVVGPAIWKVLEPWLPDSSLVLGPVLKGGQSILNEDCTHLTSGIGWPAFDTGFGDVGRDVIAPENLHVYDSSSGSQGGDAFYCVGDSGIRYWFGHITSVPAQGTRFKKGSRLTSISSDHKIPHCHLGLDARPVLGHHFISHTNYTHGAPKIGTQLKNSQV